MAIPGKTTGAEYLFRGSPEECLDSAMAYLRNKGYQIETRIENQVSMSRPVLTRRWGCFLLIMSLITFGAALLAILAMYFIKRRVTMIAMPSGGELSKVSITWSNNKAKKDLEALIAEWGDKVTIANLRFV
jgi:hypothetical protein